jgi:hypothetical protein
MADKRCWPPSDGFSGERRPAAVLAFGVPVLTLAVCLFRSSTVKTAYAILMLFMVPVWIAMAAIGIR